jgi:hypothetical protein
MGLSQGATVEEGSGAFMGSPAGGGSMCLGTALGNRCSHCRRAEGQLFTVSAWRRNMKCMKIADISDLSQFHWVIRVNPEKMLLEQPMKPP